jgi:hypothetical protein
MRQENHEFQTSLGYTMRHISKKKKKFHWVINCVSPDNRVFTPQRSNQAMKTQKELQSMLPQHAWKKLISETHTYIRHILVKLLKTRGKSRWKSQIRLAKTSCSRHACWIFLTECALRAPTRLWHPSPWHCSPSHNTISMQGLGPQLLRLNFPLPQSHIQAMVTY